MCSYKIIELNSTIAKQYDQTEDFKKKFEADKKELLLMNLL